jgi:hypothetical protein
MAVITNSIRVFLWNTLKEVWANNYSDYSPEWSMIFDEKPGEGPYIRNAGFSGLGYARKKVEGGGIAYDDMESTYIAEFEPIVWALGYKITQEAFEDNKYEELGLRKTTALARSMRQTKEIVHALILDRAFNSSYPTADTLEMCSAVHKLYGGGTFSNELAVAADLSEAALEQGCIDISKFVDDRGLLIKVLPKMLITSTDDTFNATRILKNVDRPATADRDINALVRTNMIPENMVSHYVTDTDAWFIKTDCQDGLTSYTLRAPQFTQENEFDTENFKAKATERYVPGITDVRGIYGSPGEA